MKKECYIFGAGEESLPISCPAREGVFVIAADGGYKTACRAFGKPDLAVGDFDSLGYRPADVPTLCHPAEKDDTDLALAADEALARGCRRLFLFSALGGRLDHTVANLQLLARLVRGGVEATLFGADGTAVTAIADGQTAVFSPAMRGTLSVFALGGVAEGVSLCGLRYPLDGASLYPDVPLGVSNEFLGTFATVSVRHGVLLLFYHSKEQATPEIKTNIS